MTSNIDHEECAECPMPFGKHLPDCTIGAEWNEPIATQCDDCLRLQDQVRRLTEDIAGMHQTYTNLEYAGRLQRERAEQAIQQAQAYHSEVEALTLKVLRLQADLEEANGG